MSENEITRHDHILLGLVYSLQTGAMQQMGKIQNPMTGEIQKDLEQARATIDILEMLKVKCRTDTPEEILKMLDGAVMDLQLNYMDEVKKAAAAENSGEETSEEEKPEEEKPEDEKPTGQKEEGDAEADG